MIEKPLRGSPEPEVAPLLRPLLRQVGRDRHPLGREAERLATVEYRGDAIDPAAGQGEHGIDTDGDVDAVRPHSHRLRQTMNDGDLLGRSVVRPSVGELTRDEPLPLVDVPRAWRNDRIDRRGTARHHPVPRSEMAPRLTYGSFPPAAAMHDRSGVGGSPVE